MRTLFASCVLTLMLSLSASTADSPAQLLFNKLRQNVQADLQRVPRYTCVQTVTRTQHRPQYGGRPANCQALIASRAQLGSAGLLVWHDRLRLDVAVGGDSEMFSWAGARKFESGNLADLALSGSTGTGDFGAFLVSVFGAEGGESDAAGFRYQGEEKTPLGTLAAYTFEVPFARSHYSYRTGNGGKQIVPYRGEFYAEPATADLKRLVVEATEFGTGDMCRVLDTMDYTRVKVGSGDFLLPEISKMEVLYADGEESLNETHYSNCHEFTGESTIRFDDDAGPDSGANVTKAGLQTIPARTRMRVRIDPPVNTETAAAGDAITAVPDHEVKEKGRTVLRTTDRIHGRLLRLEQVMVPEPHWIVAIRFETIERDGVEQPISLKPLDDGDKRPAPVRAIGRRMQGISIAASEIPKRPEGAGVFIFGQAGNLVLDQKFHSDWETK